MPVIRTEIHKCGLVEFAKANLPESLVVHTHAEGYTHIHYIEQKGTGTTFLGLCNRNKVAQFGWGIESETLEILDPKYFSDLEDLAVKYEKYSDTGKIDLILHKYIPCEVED